MPSKASCRRYSTIQPTPAEPNLHRRADVLWEEGLILVYRLLFILKLESAADPACAFSFASTSLWRGALSPNRALGPLVRRLLDHGHDTGRMLEDGLRFAVPSVSRWPVLQRAVGDAARAARCSARRQHHCSTGWRGASVLLRCCSIGCCGRPRRAGRANGCTMARWMSRISVASMRRCWSSNPASRLLRWRACGVRSSRSWCRLSSGKVSRRGGR